MDENEFNKRKKEVTDINIDDISPQEKARLDLAFPEFRDKLKKKQKEEQEKHDRIANQITHVESNFVDMDTIVGTQIQPLGSVNDVVINTNDNDAIFNTIQRGIRYELTGTLRGHQWTGLHLASVTKKRKPRKKLDIQKHTIKVIDLKRMVGIEGVAELDPNKIRNKRVGRIPKSKMNKKEINRIKKEHKQVEKKKKKIYDNVINLF